MTKFINLEGNIKKETTFTHIFRADVGWVSAINMPNYYDKVVYLGNCSFDGDMFACYKDDHINIYKGRVGSEF